MEVTKYWISHMRDFYVPVLVLLCLHCAKTTVHLCQLNAGSYVFLKWSENDMIWTYAQPIFECFILPLYALKQTCPMLQSVKHIVTYGKFTMTVQSQPPANISLEVRTCHLSKSWSLVHNFMFLCHNCRSTQTLYAYKIWRNIGLMHREMARGLSKNSWTNLKLGRKTRAIHTHTHTLIWLLSLRKIKSSTVVWDDCELFVEEITSLFILSSQHGEGLFLRRLQGWRFGKEIIRDLSWLSVRVQWYNKIVFLRKWKMYPEPQKWRRTWSS